MPKSSGHAPPLPSVSTTLGSDHLLMSQRTFSYFHPDIPKGQLISKGNFSVLNSPKNELENVNFCLSLVGQKIFVRFLGELRK